MKNKLDRKGKIQLLKNIQSGKATIKDMIIHEVVTYYKTADGMYIVPKEKDKLTEKEFEQHCRNYKARRRIIFSWQQGNEPLQDIYNETN